MLAQLEILKHFIYARYLQNFRSRADLEKYQQQALKKYFERVLPKAPRFRHLKVERIEDVPFMDKASMMANFYEFNTRSIELAHAERHAMQAEKNRNFSTLLNSELCVGLSSGTSGSRGIFLVSEAERRKWAGVLLARCLPKFLLKNLLNPFNTPLKLAFFLRANSPLYGTLNSRRLHLHYFDLMHSSLFHWDRLQKLQPQILVAPASVLADIATKQLQGSLSIQPLHIVSVAEVLEPDDLKLIKQVFNLPVAQIYQATEGFLAYSCEYGRLHLNESHILIERDYLEDEKKRFYPVVTDFNRHTQLIVRYKMTDILRPSEQACACGRVEQVIDAIEGRSDECLRWPDLKGAELQTVFPDALRHVVLKIQAISDYRIVQRGAVILIYLKTEERASYLELVSVFEAFFAKQVLQPPACQLAAWEEMPPGQKRRRIVCEQSYPC